MADTLVLNVPVRPARYVSPDDRGRVQLHRFLPKGYASSADQKTFLAVHHNPESGVITLIPQGAQQ